jgi:1-acylglycerone phosphate reductase
VTGPLVDIPLSQVEELYHANVFGLVRVTKAVAPHMASHKSGLIINIGSTVGVLCVLEIFCICFASTDSWATLSPTPWSGIYASSKAAVHSLTNTFAMELKPFNIKVMLVAPGAVQSNIADHSTAAFKLPPDSLYKGYLASIMYRMEYSQKVPGSYTAARFAAVVVDKALRRRPPFYLTLAPPSFLFTIFGWLPTALVRFILGRYFVTPAKKTKSD